MRCRAPGSSASGSASASRPVLALSRARPGIPGGPFRFQARRETLLEQGLRALGAAAALTLLLLSLPKGDRAPPRRAEPRRRVKSRGTSSSITIDTLRADAVGFDGNTRGTTPNLDRFAGRGPRLHEGARPQRHHAPLPREHPDGDASLPARRAGERRIPPLAEGPDGGDAAQDERLRDRRVRRRLRSGLPLRPRPRFRRLRGDVPASRRAVRVRNPAGRGRRTSSRRRSNGIGGRPAGPGSCGFTSTIRTRRTPRRRPTRSDSPTTSTSARSLTRTPRSARCWRKSGPFSRRRSSS